MYQVYTVSTATWGDKALVDASSCQWRRTYNESAGVQQATFNLSDPDVQALNAAGLFTPLERAIVVEYDGSVVYAGIVWEDDYDCDSEQLVVKHEDVWSLVALRLIAEDRSGAIAEWVRSYTTLADETVLKRLVQLATSGAGRGLPIVFESDQSASGNEHTYYGYNLDTLIDAMGEIINAPSGPNVDFKPSWAPGGETLRWHLRTGDMNPDGRSIEVNAAADDSALRGIKRVRSGREVATRVMGVGEGSGIDIRVRAAAESSSMHLEVVDQAKNIKTLTGLQRFANGRLAARSRLITQYSGELLMTSDAVGNVAQLHPGVVLRWYMRGDPVISTGWKSHRMIGYGGEISSDWLSLALQ